MRISPEASPHAFGKKNFIINTNSPLVTSIYHLQAQNPEMAKAMVHHLYDLTLLSQKEMDIKNFNAFISRSNNLLEKVVQSFSGNHGSVA